MIPRFPSPRVTIGPIDHPANANINFRYAIEKAAWLWHPDHDGKTPGLFRFGLEFSLDEAVDTRIHVSGDERYFLFVDGKLLSRGPDSSDPEHWSFASYDLSLEAGSHRFEALVSWLGDIGPYGVMTCRPGFVLSMDALPHLDTGAGNWRSSRVRGVEFGPGLSDPHTFHVIGPSYTIDAESWASAVEWKEPSVWRNLWRGKGTIQPGHRFSPSQLTEQMWRPRSLGLVRAMRPYRDQDEAWNEPLEVADLRDWQRLANGESELSLEPGAKIEVLFDLQDYICGYSFIRWSGKGSKLRWLWAESLYMEPLSAGRRKGDRGQVAGKFYRGFGDTFVAGTALQDSFVPWWRSGRFVVLQIEAGACGVRLESLAIAETRYDKDLTLEIEVPDQALAQSLPLMLRTMEVGHHEVFCDSPYYEQMMYTGDTYVRLLCEYQVTDDLEPARRVLELFDWSRLVCGWQASRYPCRRFQLIPAYSLSWIFMLEDYALWRDDLGAVRTLLPGMRAILDLWLEVRTPEHLVDHPPGWNILDTVPNWTSGEPPGLGEGGSTSINLLFIMALKAAVRLEEWLGNEARANVWRLEAAALQSKLAELRWDSATGLWRESADGYLSEHAQALAQLAGCLPTADAARAFLAWQAALPLFPRTNLFFEFYIFEALVKVGRADLMLDRFDDWRDMAKKNFLTTPEFREDDTRSDCHAWSAHPVYHIISGVAGIRPVAPGFAKVRIRPQPGNWPWLRVTTCHPKGKIRVDLTFSADGKGVKGSVFLPDCDGGEFVWGESVQILLSGCENIISIKASEAVMTVRTTGAPRDGDET